MMMFGEPVHYNYTEVPLYYSSDFSGNNMHYSDIHGLAGPSKGLQLQDTTTKPVKPIVAIISSEASKVPNPPPQPI